MCSVVVYVDIDVDVYTRYICTNTYKHIYAINKKNRKKKESPLDNFRQEPSATLEFIPLRR